MGEAIFLPEAVGATIAFSGAVLCSRDAASDDEGGSSLRGDGYAIICAIAGLVYLITAKTVRPVMHFYLFMFCVMSVASVDALILALLAGIEISWDRDLTHGVFGWMNTESDRLPVEMAMIISCQFFGAMGKQMRGLARCLCRTGRHSHYLLLIGQATFAACTTSAIW
jgi:K+-sensing histidine kinase KdpD